MVIHCLCDLHRSMNASQQWTTNPTIHGLWCMDSIRGRYVRLNEYNCLAYCIIQLRQQKLSNCSIVLHILAAMNLYYIWTQQQWRPQTGAFTIFECDLRPMYRFHDCYTDVNDACLGGQKSGHATVTTAWQQCPFPD